MKKLLTIFLLAVLALSFVSASESSLSVPLDSDVYRIIDSAEMRGIIPSQTDVRPYSLSKVKSLLDVISSSDRISEGERSAIDDLLDSFESSYGFSDEKSLLQKGYISTTLADNTSVAVGVKTKTTAAFGFRDKSLDSRNKATAYVRAELFDAFSLYMDFTGLMDKLDHRSFLVTDFRHECDGFYMSFEGYGGLETSPFSRFGVGIVMNPELATTFFDGRLLLRFASVSRDWGPGLNNIALSASARNFDGVELSLEPVSWFSLSVAVGSLGKSYLTLSGEASPVGDTGMHSDVYDNNFSIQRVEVEFFEGLRASIYESVIWRKRFELAYLNPVGIYMFAQNYIGDYDNMLAGGDLTYTWKGVGKFYLAFAIDELNKAKLFWARNIIAWQGGATFDIPVLEFSTLRLQATYIPPFFGTHYTYRANNNPWGTSAIGTAYINKGYTMSYPLYPDSVELLASFSTTVSSWGLSLDFTLRDQMRSAQYSTSGSEGTTLNTLINYKYSDSVSSYAKKKFFSYIWDNIVCVDVEAKKSFENTPFSLNVGVECIVESKRSYTLDPDIVKEYAAYDFVNEGGPEKKMITNPGTGTVMNDDWSTSARVNLSIGFSIYY